MTRDEFEQRTQAGRLLLTDPDAYLYFVTLAEERDRFRKALVRIANAESGHWGWIAHEVLNPKPSDSSSAAQSPPPDRSKHAAPRGVSGSLVRGGDPDPSLNPRKAA